METAAIQPERWTHPGVAVPPLARRHPLKKLITIASVATMLVGAASTHAAEGPEGGLGFRSRAIPVAALASAPFDAVPSLGGRHWLNDQFGIDLGLGFNQSKYKEPAPEQSFTAFSIDVGVPISLKKVSDKVNFIFRPGFQWSSIEDKLDATALSPESTIKTTGFAVSGELEVEFMVTEYLSVSASHGIHYFQAENDLNPKEKFTSFGSEEGNFTQLGFHVYLW